MPREKEHLLCCPLPREQQSTACEAVCSLEASSQHHCRPGSKKQPVYFKNLYVCSSHIHRNETESNFTQRQAFVSLPASRAKMIYQQVQTQRTMPNCHQPFRQLLMYQILHSGFEKSFFFSNQLKTKLLSKAYASSAMEISSYCWQDEFLMSLSRDRQIRKTLKIYQIMKSV